MPEQLPTGSVLVWNGMDPLEARWIEASLREEGIECSVSGTELLGAFGDLGCFPIEVRVSGRERVEAAAAIIQRVLDAKLGAAQPSRPRGIAE